MIRIDLARTIAEQMNIHTKDEETFLTIFTDIVSDSLANGEPVRLAGFGTFDIATEILPEYSKWGQSESAGINRHRVGDERAPHERNNCTIMAPSHARVAARPHVKR